MLFARSPLPGKGSASEPLQSARPPSLGHAKGLTVLVCSARPFCRSSSTRKQVSISMNTVNAMSRQTAGRTPDAGLSEGTVLPLIYSLWPDPAKLHRFLRRLPRLKPCPASRTGCCSASRTTCTRVSGWVTCHVVRSAEKPSVEVEHFRTDSSPTCPVAASPFTCCCNPCHA